jgi:hypothetical protein
VRSGKGWDKDEADSHFEMDMLWSVDNQGINIVCISRANANMGRNQLLFRNTICSYPKPIPKTLMT